VIAVSKLSRLSAALALTAGGVVCGSYFLSPAPAQDKQKAPAPAAAKWEYRVVPMICAGINTNGTEFALNKLGEEGFEVVFTTPTKAMDNNNKEQSVVYYTLRRAK